MKAIACTVPSVMSSVGSSPNMSVLNRTAMPPKTWVGPPKRLFDMQTNCATGVVLEYCVGHNGDGGRGID